MLFGDVSLVTCLPGFTLSSGAKCGADAKFFLWGLSQCVHHELQCSAGGFVESGKSFLALREVTDVFLQLVAQNRIVSKWKATRSVI